MFSKVSHYYLYLSKTYFFFYKFNVNILFNLKKIYSNYSNLLLVWLKIFRGVVSLDLKSLPVSYLTQHVGATNLFSKQSFQSLFAKNNQSKSLSNSFLFDNSDNPLISVYNYFFLYNDLFYFLSKKKNSLTNFFNLLLNLKFNYFILLINCNWHLILNLNNLFGSIRFSVISIVKMKGMRQYGLYSISYL